MLKTEIETSGGIHKILFATDLTDASRKAFKYARAVARHFQVPVTIAHVLGASASDWPNFGTDPQYKKLWHDTKRRVDRLEGELHRAGFQADGVLLEGDPVPGILKAVKHHKVDLLILGTHGSKNLNRLLLGSTAEEVLRKASCPVLTVGSDIHDPKRGDRLFRRIILATHLNPKAAAAVVHAFSLVAEQATHVSICHVIPEGGTKTADTAVLQRKLMQTVKKLIAEDIRSKCEAEYIVEYGKASDEILELAGKQHADLIILGAHPASAVVTHLAPGIAFRVILGAACPVLTIRI